MAKKHPTLDSGEDASSNTEENTGQPGSLLAGDVDLLTLFATIIDLTLRTFIGKLQGDTQKSTVPSVGDVIRLMQLRRELKAEEPIREIEVRWVDPSGTDS